MLSVIIWYNIPQNTLCVTFWRVKWAASPHVPPNRKWWATSSNIPDELTHTISGFKPLLDETPSSLIAVKISRWRISTILTTPGTPYAFLKHIDIGSL